MILFTKGTELTIFGQLKILMIFSIKLNLKTFRLLNCLHMIFLHCILRLLWYTVELADAQQGNQLPLLQQVDHNVRQVPLNITI